MTHGNIRHGHASRLVTGAVSKTYKSWDCMKQRCNFPSAPNYEYYGGKGISYDSRWEDFNTFLADMGERPEGTTLDRIESTDNYYKNNCRWLDKAGQAQNRKTPSSNTSGCKGVRWDKKAGKWRAQGARKGVITPLYYGHSFEEACAARRLWENNG